MYHKFVLFCCTLLLLFTSCSSLRNIALNSVSTSLSGANKKGIPIKRSSKNAEEDPMLAITGETDVTLVSDFFPTVLEMYEILHRSNPQHAGLSTMTGSLNVMYANAFVQGPAEFLSPAEYALQDAEYARAKLHYLRGRNYCLAALEKRYKGFSEAVLSTDTAKADAAITQLDEKDVNTAYWAGAGWLGAFSLDPLNADLLGTLHSPVALLEKAAELSPDYSDGAIWELLANFYISAPPDFGGDSERAQYCYEQALRVSGGKAAGLYVTYARAFCIPNGDEAGYVEALQKALSIDPNANEASRLMTTLSQQKATYLLKHKGDYFLEW
ncbi:MAG: TRAP transporter TatT component family protein [Treponema sp.]|nr:TRAP transporter TatT component family protein [Treponema sp.]